MNAARKRPGFTLVELLVVVGIIAILAALLTPVVMQSLAKARNAAIKAEIDMLHMAIMNYKNEYGSFPPCDSPLPYGTASPAVKHVTKLFPRCTSVVTQFTAAGLSSPEQPYAAVDPTNALIAWLGGYTDDPTSPLRPSASRKKLFDFDQSRISGLTYSPPGKSGSPYVYINSSNYVIGGSVGTFGSYYAHRVPVSAAGDFQTLAQPAFNPDTFQILCAGRDEQFSTDDDLSNFWPGTRREYLDSLKD